MLLLLLLLGVAPNPSARCAKIYEAFEHDDLFQKNVLAPALAKPEGATTVAKLKADFLAVCPTLELTDLSCAVFSDKQTKSDKKVPVGVLIQASGDPTCSGHSETWETGIDVVNGAPIARGLKQLP